MQLFLTSMSIAGFLAAPVSLIWGWVRWANRSTKTGNAAILSFAGLLFATTSALLAGGAILYSFWIGGFPYYDPRLLKIYFFGIVLSLPAITLSALGAARKNLLRWHALGSSAGIFLFWFMAMLSE
jgi:hypothetical protein